MQLADFFDYKNQLMQDLLTTESIVKLIDSHATLDTATGLAYTKVFPYEYIPETVEEASTFVCFDVELQKAPTSKTFLSPILYIWVFTHRTKFRLDGGGVLIDKLVSEIAEKINGSRLYGMGELDLYTVRRFAPVSDYQGKVMTFGMTEWNRPSPSNKSIPKNRKTV